MTSSLISKVIGTRTFVGFTPGILLDLHQVSNEEKDIGETRGDISRKSIQTNKEKKEELQKFR